MSTMTERATTATDTGRLRVGSALMALAGVAFIGYGTIFLIHSFTSSFLELGIGPSEVASSRDQIREFDPGLYHYIAHLHIAISGFIAATGLATAALSWYGVRGGLWWAYVTAIAAPVLALAVALPAHYPWHLDTLGHLGLIYMATAVFVVGAAIALKPMVNERAGHQSRLTR